MAVVTDPASPIVAGLQGLHLFHFEGAPCAQRVRFALYEKGLLRDREERFDDGSAAASRAADNGWVSRHVSLVRREHFTEAYAQIQPNLVVPALVHDGVLHIESMDIVEYLDENFGGEPLVPRHDARLLAEVEALTDQGKALHRSIRFVTYRWGLRGLARLNRREEAQLREILRERKDGENLVEFYEGYDRRSIPDSVYREHLDRLIAAYRDNETRLGDGRAFLTGDTLTMADVIWAMKTQRLAECGFPFARSFPRVQDWFDRVASRPSFREGVMGRYRLMSTAFRFKAAAEQLIGIGLRREVLRSTE